MSMAVNTSINADVGLGSPQLFRNDLRPSSDNPFICISQGHNPFGIFYSGPNAFSSSFARLLLEISLVILATRFFRFLLKPLKQPRVVCEILGGIVIGPSILRRNETFRDYIFPDDVNFVIKNVGIIGFMYFLFISGVKMDMTVLKKSRKKHVCVALLGMFVPMILVTAVAFSVRGNMDRHLAKISSIGAVSSALAITAFPVLYPILKELNLLSSEVGQMALTTAIFGDAVGMNAVIVFEAATQAEARAIDALWYVISLVGVGAFMMIAVRPALAWIINRTPEGADVDQAFTTAILLGVLVIGFLTDMFGIAIANGPLWLGLMIPDGPPLGSTLVHRSETIISELLMPFAYAYIGLCTDVFALAPFWSRLGPLFAMAVTGYLTKLVVTLLATLPLNMPLRDCLALSLIMGLRGQVELLLFIHWRDKKIIELPSITMMVLLTTAVTALATPLINILYDPKRPYMVNKRRTLQHTPPGAHLRILLCIYDKESVISFLNLLEVSNPTRSSPCTVCTLHLIELVGRASPLLIDHNKRLGSRVTSKYKDIETILHAFKIYVDTRSECLQLHAFTAISPKKTMYQDICQIALTTKATLIILPFHRETTIAGAGIEFVRKGVRSANSQVLANAPCSVGILVDRGNFKRNPMISSDIKQRHFLVLFLGGADAREALVYADRMEGNLGMRLTVVRFLSHNYLGDKEMEKKLDDGVVTWFWVKHEANEKVAYKEIVVRSGEETIAAIQALKETIDNLDLWILGRGRGINPVLLNGLNFWGDSNELGLVGDFISSPDFGSFASVLVVQQQIMREQRMASKSPLDRLFNRLWVNSSL